MASPKRVFGSESFFLVRLNLMLNGRPVEGLA